MRKAYINQGSDLLVSVTGNTSNIGTIGTAPEDDNYSFYCINVSAVRCTWTLTKHQTEKMVLNNFIEIGRRLAEAKGLIKYGEWGNWLKEEVGFS